MAKAQGKQRKKTAQPLYGDADVNRECDIPDSTPFDAQDGHNAEFRRDYARLVHSPAFRRLQGKTQLFPGTESDFFRNRLTHSMEVAQIAKGIALKLNATPFFIRNPINTDLVELAALAHDLGHPPFGHNGEHALDECMRDHGGFEGNAQTLRILARLEKREINGAQPGERCGLNFTHRSLAAVLKYDAVIPALYSQRLKPKLAKGYYGSEAELVQRIKVSVAPDCADIERFRTIECDIMDIADDIAYSTYDLEDAFKAGFFNPIEILSHVTDTDFLEKVAVKVRAADATLEDVTPEQVGLTLMETFGGVVAEGSADINKSDALGSVRAIIKIFSKSKRIASDGYLRTAFTSELVKEFIGGVTATANEKCPSLSHIAVNRATRLKIEALKHLTFEALTMSPRLRLVEYRGRDIVKAIFLALTNEERAGHMLLPDDWRERYVRLDDDAERKRLVCDFVAGMTDRYAVEFYGRLTSVDSQLSFFKPF
jgi:dGTPase